MMRFNSSYLLQRQVVKLKNRGLSNKNVTKFINILNPFQMKIKKEVK